MSPFSAIFVPDELADALSDRAWLEALLDAERALLDALVVAGLVPAAAAAAVADVLRAELYDCEALAREGRAAGNPVEPLVRAIRARVGEEHAGFVHLGATSQDILDSASMLVARRALRLIDAELGGAAEACARLAEEHRGTVMAARTLLQQAVPTTFGYKAAGWLVGRRRGAGAACRAGAAGAARRGRRDAGRVRERRAGRAAPVRGGRSASVSRPSRGTRAARRSSTSRARSREPPAWPRRSAATSSSSRRPRSPR